MRNFLHASLGLFLLISTNNTQAQNESITILNDPIVTVLSETSVEITFETDVVSVGLIEYDSKNHSGVRMMPLGNSITKGVGSSHGGGYRLHLYSLLTNYGTVFDFVGGENQGSGLPDTDHEGHGGWRVDQILGDIHDFLDQSPADVIFLHIGTNDVSINESAEEIYNEIIALINAIYDFYPDTKLYISTLIPRQDSKQSVNDTFNTFIPAITNLISNANYEIYLVDNAARFTQNNNWQSQWMDDDLHPNDDGYEVMAEEWFDDYSQTEYKYVKSDPFNTTSHSILLSGLKPGTTYTFKARAIDLDDNEDFSDNHNFSTSGLSPSTRLTEIKIFPDSLSLSVGQEQQFMALGLDQFGEPISVEVDWSANGGGITADGLFSAGNDGELTSITASDGSISSTIILNYSPRFEAESLALTTFTRETNQAASNGKLISLKGGAPSESGTASGIFVGATGNYKIVVGYYDENDGDEAEISFFVDGNLIDNWQLNDPSGGSGGADESTFRERTVAENIVLQLGTTFSLDGQESPTEHARIDYIDFEPETIPNLPPIAFANADLTSGEAPLTVNFTGNGSDSDGSITGFSWNFGDGQSSNQQNPQHTYNNPGQFQAILTVTDNIGATGSDTVDISVSQPQPILTSIVISPDTAFVSMGENFQFNANGFDQFDGPFAINPQWTSTGGTISQQGLFTAENQIGTFQVTASQNNIVANAVVQVTVPNSPPIANATSDITSGDAPLTVNFTGNGSDSDGSIASFSWSFGDGQSSSQQNPQHTYNNPGQFQAILTVTDNIGATGSDTVDISVSQPQPVLTSIVLSPNAVTLTSGQSQQFSANGFDQFNDPFNINPQWAATGGTISPQGLFTAGSEGIFQVTATQGNATGQASVTVIQFFPGDSLRIEAENLNLSTYRTESNNSASENSMISLKGGSPLESGTASGTFEGTTGLYDIKIAYFDENDGDTAHATFSINGQTIDSWIFDDPSTGSAGAAASSLIIRTVAQNIFIQNGDIFELSATESNKEHARIDYIDFVPVQNPALSKQSTAGLLIVHQPYADKNDEHIVIPLELSSNLEFDQFEILFEFDQSIVDIFTPSKQQENFQYDVIKLPFGLKIIGKKMENANSHFQTSKKSTHLQIFAYLKHDHILDSQIKVSDAKIIASNNKQSFNLYTDNALIKLSMAPKEFQLFQNYPNPFNAQTRIKFAIPKKAKIELQIYNIKGRLVRNLISNESYEPGVHNILWDGKSDKGLNVSSGIYLYNLKADQFRATKTFMLIK